MKTTAIFSLTFFFSFLLSGQEKDLLDSIVYSDKGFIEAKIYKNPGNAFALKHTNISKEIRFYDEYGFFCLAVFLDKRDSLIREKQGNLLKYYSSMDYNKDPVFLSDTFALGFVNKLKSYQNMSIPDRLEETILFYYSQRDYTKVEHIKNFLDKHDKEVVIAIDSAIDIIEEFVPYRFCRWSLFYTQDEYKYFGEGLFTDVRITQKELERIGHQVTIEFETTISGKILSIKLITKLHPKVEKQIMLNIEKMKKYKFIPCSARCRASNLKGALYFNLY